MLLLGAAIVCFYVADSGTSSWSSDYLHEVLHTTNGVAALAYGFYTGASLVSRLVGDHVVRRVGAPPWCGRRASGHIGLVFVVVAPSAAVAIAGFTILGLGMGVVAPLSFAAAGELSPGNADAVVAQVNVFNYVGFVLGGVVVGIFGSAGVLRAGFVVPMVLSLVIVALAPAFHPRPGPVPATLMPGGRSMNGPDEQHQRLERATAHLDPPFAVVDLDAFDGNARDLARRATGVPIRVASKSVRVRELVDRAVAAQGFSGVMTFALREAIWLARQGHRDLLMGYPTVDRAALQELAGDEELRAEHRPDGRPPGPARAGACGRRDRAGPGAGLPRRRRLTAGRPAAPRRAPLAGAPAGPGRGRGRGHRARARASSWSA